MDWVWTQSAAKGTARMVLLAIADKCPDDTCTAYAGTTMLVRRTNAARSSVVAAVDKLLAGDELRVVEGAKGPRGRPSITCRAPSDTSAARPTRPVSGPGIRTGTESDRSENRTPGGTKAGPEGYGNRTPPVRNPDPRTQENASTKQNSSSRARPGPR